MFIHKTMSVHTIAYIQKLSPYILLQTWFHISHSKKTYAWVSYYKTQQHYFPVLYNPRTKIVTLMYMFTHQNYKVSLTMKTTYTILAIGWNWCVKKDKHLQIYHSNTSNKTQPYHTCMSYTTLSINKLYMFYKSASELTQKRKWLCFVLYVTVKMSPKFSKFKPYINLKATKR